MRFAATLLHIEKLSNTNGPSLHSLQAEQSFSISLEEIEEGLPTQEIVFYEEGGAADTPLTEKMPTTEDTDEATEPKHPHAPKHKQLAELRKFTFEGWTPGNSMVESRDEDHGPDDVKEPEHESVDESPRDEPKAKETRDEESEMSEAKTDSMEMDLVEITRAMSGPEMPPMAARSFPAVPFDEDPSYAAKVNEVIAEPEVAESPNDTVMAIEDVSVDEIMDISKIKSEESFKSAIETEDSATFTVGVIEEVPMAEEKVDEQVKSEKSIKMVKEVPKVTVPVLSPSSAAVMSMPKDSFFPGDLETAPSDEMFGESADNSANNSIMDEEAKANDLVDLLKERLAKARGTSEDASAHSTTDNNNDRQETVQVPSVVCQSGDSEEPIELASATATMGDFRNQIDQLRVAEALEAVTHSLQGQSFLGTETFCGQDIMEWFGSSKTTTTNDPDGTYRP